MLYANHPRTLCVAAIVCLIAGTGMAAPRAHAADKQPHKRFEQRQVEALEEQWRQAQLSGDTVAMDKLLADDYIGIGSNGLISNKAEQLARVRNRQMVLTKLDVSDVKVKLIGSIAIVTSRVNVEGSNEGASLAGVYRYTRIYSRLPSGAWKITNFESTRIMPRAMRGPGSPMGVPPSPTQ